VVKAVTPESEDVLTLEENPKKNQRNMPMAKIEKTKMPINIFFITLLFKVP
jgi:hypothetical protein